MKRLAAAIVLIGGLVHPQSADPFLEKPYLQLGDNPKLAKQETLALLWHTTGNRADWSVEVRERDGTAWRKMPAPQPEVVDVRTVPKHYVWRVTLSGLAPGEEFHYRVVQNTKPVFEAVGKARKAANQPVRFALFGDCGENTAGQRAVAYQTSLQNPDFLFITGDIVYDDGRISEYRTKFYPIYNRDEASAQGGAPLLRSIPFLAAPGNHDTALRSFPRFPDALAYFLYWDQPLNGPPNPALQLIGNLTVQAAFKAAAQNRWPVMANFSFDYGNAHWTVLDSNPYMDWNRPELKKWVADDLAAAKGATWRFVAYHDSAFNSAKEHFAEQAMRVLAPVFEEGGVDVVFNGHVHNYQRSFPLKFAPRPQPGGRVQGPEGQVKGEFRLDTEFRDGATAKPNGVIYIVSGGGGAALYNREQMKNPAGWQPFTAKFIADVHSFTLVDLNDSTFELKQISETGKEVDAFRIVK
jgi:acid phosphatase type 7